MWLQLSRDIDSFSLDQYLCDFIDHGRSYGTPWYIDILILVLRLVLLGLVHDYDNYWHVLAFVFSYAWPHTLVWYIFTWICNVIFGSHVGKVSEECNEQLSSSSWFHTTPLMGYL
jgi:hypothetical protein